MAPTISRGGIDRRRSGRRSMRACSGTHCRVARRCPPHCTLAQRSERAVAPVISRGGIDRRRSGRRSMAGAQARTIALARRTALSPKAASVQWHPLNSQPHTLAPRTALSLNAASVQWHPSSRGVASIAAAPGGDRWRVCRGARSPLPLALHSRSTQRACSGTHFCDGWHRSPPLWAEIDGEGAGVNDRPCPPHCTLAQSGERAVAPT